MSVTKLSVVGTLAFAANVAAHGFVSQIKVGSEYLTGFSPSFNYYNPAPIVVGWSATNTDNGFVAPAAFSDPDIVCHRGATNAKISATVAAGSTVDLLWNTWPESHHGPVLDYLAPCNGDCTTVDKTSLEFFKIHEGGLVSGSNPGLWASDQLIANNNTWSVTIPADIAPGNYVLRHEIIALHSAGSINGAQNYPQCINLVITGSGTAKPAGQLGTTLYKETDPGIEVNIYQALTSYIIPGPAVYSAAGGAPAATSPVAVETPVAETSAIASAVETSAVETPAAETPAVETPAAETSAVAPIISAPYSNSTATHSSGPSPTKRPEITKTQKGGNHGGRPTSTAAGPVAPSTKVSIVTSSSPVDIIPEPTAIVEPTPVTGAPATTVVASPSATSTVPPMPAGTTLTDLLNWLAAMIQDILAGKASAVARRHARDLPTHNVLGA